MKKLFIILLLSLAMVCQSFAADNDNWTCTSSASGDVLTCIPAAGFTNLNTVLLTGWTKGMYVESVEIKWSNASDTIVLRDGSATGGIILDQPAISLAGMVKYFNQYSNRAAGSGRFFFKPYIKATDVTFTTPASIRVIFHAVPVSKAGP